MAEWNEKEAELARREALLAEREAQLEKEQAELEARRAQGESGKKSLLKVIEEKHLNPFNGDGISLSARFGYRR